MITAEGAPLVEALLDLDPTAAEDFLTAASARTWLALDEAARYSSWVRPAWTAVLDRRLTIGGLERVLMACGPSGWVREAEVAVIAKRGEWPQVLALRSADWVAQVRDRARTACERLLEGPGVVEMAPVAFALRERRLGGWLADRVETALREAEPEVLAAALAVADVRVRRLAHDVALTRGSLGLDSVLRGALRDPDLPIRLRCVAAATRLADDVDALRVLLSCRAASVRAEAVRVLGRRDAAVTALFDRSPLVRSVAQRLVPDAADRYRAALPRGVAGLGETGEPADAALVRPWLEDPEPRVRAAAVRALRRLGAVDVELVERMLADPSDVVVRAVVAALRGRVVRLDRDRLLALLESDGRMVVRNAAYRLLRESGVWVRLLTDLRLVAVDDELRHRALADLHDWMSSRSATAYTPPNPVELRQALRAAEPHLPAGLERWVRFVIG